jgi:hypothetical protein
MLVLQVVRAKDGILAMPIPGHRALIVSTVLASVKGSLAALGGCAALDTGCAPCLLAFKRWPGGTSHLTEKGPSLYSASDWCDLPGRTPGTKYGTVCQMGQLLKGLQSFRHRANKALGVRSFIRSARIEGRSGLRTHEPYSEPPDRMCEQRCLP